MLAAGSIPVWVLALDSLIRVVLSRSGFGFQPRVSRNARQNA